MSILYRNVRFVLFRKNSFVHHQNSVIIFDVQIHRDGPNISLMESWCVFPLQVPIRKPIFIVGHYRTGTTFLNWLLACDPQFRYASNCNPFFGFFFFFCNFQMLLRYYIHKKPHLDNKKNQRPNL